jgi:hypothetical protein
MIHPLRQRHRRFVTVLAVVLPLVFMAALFARRMVPPSGAPVSDPARPITKHPGSETGAPR